MTETSTALGQFIRSCRSTLRFTCQKVEELSVAKPYYERISPANLVDIEYGRHVPSFGKILTLSEILDVPLHHFEERYRVDREGSETLPAGSSHESLAAEAHAFMMAGQHRKALVRYKQARNLVPAGTIEHVEADIQIANCRKRIGMLRVAREDLERILGLPELDDTLRIKASAYLAEAFSLARNPFMAKVLLREAISLARKKSLDQALPKLHAHLGAVYYVNMEFTAALREFRAAHQGFRGSNDRLSAAMTLANIGNCLMHSGKLIEAERIQLETARIASEMHYTRGVALAHCNLAELNFLRKEYETSRSNAVQCLSLARPEEYHDLISQSSYFLWEIARHAGDRVQERLNFNTLRRHTRFLEYKLPTLKTFYEYVEKERAAPAGPGKGEAR